MKQFSGQFIFTNTGPALKRGIITTEDDGTIVKIEDTGGELNEKEAVEFHNGIIIPGFVNCHCHLELSDLKNIIQPGRGLADFILDVRTSRDYDRGKTIRSASSADEMLFMEGIVLCADICNSDVTFEIKKKSSITYINLLEVFGIDPEKAERRLNEILQVSHSAESSGMQFWLVPHSAYSISLPLFRLLKFRTDSNRVTSLHFMESQSEIDFLNDQTGAIKDSYKRSGLVINNPETVKDHPTAVLDEITASGNLILVHNTFADRNTIRQVKKRKNLFWCLCPRSNLYIENRLPPLELLNEENCEIVIGTDSLASNRSLSILEELKLLQKSFTSIPLGNLILWATNNGARALGEENNFGSIAPGKKPGLLLIQDIDLINMKLTEESRIKRLI